MFFKVFIKNIHVSRTADTASRHLEQRKKLNKNGIKLEETSTHRERLEFKQRKDRAFSTMYYGVDDQHKTLLSSLNDAAEAWKLPQEQFEPKSRASVIRLLDEVFPNKI
ncbi:hypothetical protein CEXT_496591 [Caerostris extrusa]|uniref:Uncharacterized protein n=1 Tax=Caerostris extrusa TaxID=172846 RepID=A0AAV4SD01_CAEEX|nr:hypothetical protein CEXT_496591 [Caerostris extrusa]